MKHSLQITFVCLTTCLASAETADLLQVTDPGRRGSVLGTTTGGGENIVVKLTRELGYFSPSNPSGQNIAFRPGLNDTKTFTAALTDKDGTSDVITLSVLHHKNPQGIDDPNLNLFDFTVTMTSDGETPLATPPNLFPWQKVAEVAGGNNLASALLAGLGFGGHVQDYNGNNGNLLQPPVPFDIWAVSDTDPTTPTPAPEVGTTAAFAVFAGGLSLSAFRKLRRS